MSGLVLSLFPGIGLLDMAFEEEGFCVVRGPDLLWGGDVRRFHPPAGVFDGVIGGPPCQAFSQLRHIVEANGYQCAPNLIPEFERVTAEAAPRWFLMENVRHAPAPVVGGYVVTSQLVEDAAVGGSTQRVRRFSLGALVETHLPVEVLPLFPVESEPAVTCDKRRVPVKLLSGLKPKKISGGRTSSLNRGGGSETIERMLELQGLPQDFFDEKCPLTAAGKKRVIGNGVPLPMGRAIARAVKRATTGGRQQDG